MASRTTPVARANAPPPAPATGGRPPPPPGAPSSGARRAPINNKNDNFGADEQTEVKVTPKSPETFNFIVAALKNHFLFSSLAVEDLRDCVGVMGAEQKGASEEVIKQGEAGNKFYVLESGTCDVFVSGTRVTSYSSGAAFGELALMYNCPRAATVLATSPCTLWTLDRRTFRRLLTSSSSSAMLDRCNFLKQVPLLKSLSNEQVSKVAKAMGTAQFRAGEYIIRQGEEGDTFYVVMDGSVKCTHSKGEGVAGEIELLRLGAGDYFGEMALLLEEPRHANVVAMSEVECLTMGRSAFLELLGPLRDLLDQQMRIRVLRSVPLLAALTDGELDLVANSMRVQVFAEGQYIIRQGEAGNAFYIINEGEVRVTKSDGGEEKEIVRLSNHEFFGEMALMTDEPRKANVIALGPVECLVLRRRHFNELLGSVEATLAREVERRLKMEDEAKAGSSAGAGAAAAAAVAAAATVAASSIPFERLRQLRTIGTGTFGRVKIVQDTASGRVMALKAMQKAQVLASHQERNIMNEKNICAACRHPFILQLVQTYTDRDCLYMLMELVQGGELWSLLYEKVDCLPRSALGGLVSEHARFYAACVTSAFRYLGGMGVAYRDLKPENLLVDSQGFLKMVDFGFAKHIPFMKGKVEQLQSFTLCGTPEYLSPELVLSKGHDKSVDYWALGCLIFELLVGQTPFADQHQSEIFKKIIHSERSIHFPVGFDANARDLVQRLLMKNPAQRLGNLAGGVGDIQNHPWFVAAGFDWSALESRTVSPPYSPPIADALDTANFDQYQEDDNVEPYYGSQAPFEAF